MMDDTAHESRDLAVPAVRISRVVEPINAADTSGVFAVNRILQPAGIEQCGVRDPVIAFCCRDSAIMFWSRLMGLPRELRKMVYAAYFDDLPSKIILRPNLRRVDRFPSIVPALCYANKQTFAESVPVLLHDKQIVVNDTAHALLIRFLVYIPENKGYRAITKLQMEGVFHLPGRGETRYYTFRLTDLPRM
jgi:hypothetical protein